MKGLTIPRYYTQAGVDPFASTVWTTRTSRITNPDGSVVFEMKDAEIPASWSQVATDIMVSKYFRKAGVPLVNDDGSPVLDDSGNPVLGPERSAQAGDPSAWPVAGAGGARSTGYFATAEDAQAFYDELVYMLVNQMAAPNSPQWFNTGLAFAYGITGPAQGHFYYDPEAGVVRESNDAYTRPQPHACFIQGVSDDLVGDGGIMDLWVREARLFKFGSGTGTNFSNHPRRGRAALRRRVLVRPDELPARGRPRRLAPSRAAAPPAAPPRWSASISITPISKRSSTGRLMKSARSPP